nr:MAG TPA: hypothetical protein [Caudoviricetes sp.]
MQTELLKIVYDWCAVLRSMRFDRSRVHRQAYTSTNTLQQT